MPVITRAICPCRHGSR